MIKLYLNDLKNKHKTKKEWEIQLTMSINFISSKNSEEICTMHTKSDYIKTTIVDEPDQIIKGLFNSLLHKYQQGLEESMKGSKFVFDSVNLLYYKFHRISLNRNRSYIDFAKWLRNKKVTINSKHNDDKCFQYAVTVALNREPIKKDPQRISKIKPFINQYNWK